MTVTFDAARAEAFADRLFGASVEAYDLLSVYIGDRAGLYAALREGPATADDLATRAGIAPRYAREWLEQQAVTGILEVDDASLAPEARRFSLPDEHAAALTDPDSPYSLAPLARFVVACAKATPKLLDAYRTGSGIDWSEFGDDAIESQGDFNRPWIVAQLGQEYLPAVTDVHERLVADPPARVADVACGVGWAAIAIAKAYPKVHVDGYDLDETSIGIARRLAQEHGVADRVSFEVRDASAASAQERYDLAIMVEALHDLSRPVEVLAAIREMLAPGGILLVADEKTADAFTAPGDEVERILYGFSITSCLPAGLADDVSAATGAVLRPDVLRRYASDAGFGRAEVVDAIDHPLLRFYRLSP